MAGRPTKLTPDVQRKMIDAIRAGNYREAACTYAGIDYATFKRWMQRGDREPGDYRAFRAAVHEAEAQAEVRIVAQWQQQIPENWQAAKDFLARRYPERWAETHKIVKLVEQELDKALDKLSDKLPQDIYARVVAILADEAGEDAV